VSSWTPKLFLEKKGREPVYLQIAKALIEEIQRGRFRPGDPLPSYRTLVAQLEVSRNTVTAAYRELEAQGWIAVTRRSGVAVAPRQAPGAAGSISVDLQPARPRADLLQVATGNPDPRLLPTAALAQAYRRALTLNQGAALAVDDPLGHPRLRVALAAMLAKTRAIAADPDRLLVIRSAQMGLFLLGQALLRPGDVVAVEALGDRGAWEAFAHAGARCLPVPVDAEGLCVDSLEALLAQHPVRAVLLSPSRHYPTLVALSPARRARLLELAARHRLAVLESEQDAEFQFDGQPLAPLASTDPSGVVVHLGVFSRIFSPGLRLGFVHGPAPLIDEMRRVRAVLDRQGDPVLERAMAELLEDGEVQRHLNRMHPIYLHRRDVLCAALEKELGPSVEVEAPSGGLALWVRTIGGLDVDAWAARAIEGGVAFQAGRRFAFDGGPVPGLRLGFAAHDEEQLNEVAKRLAAARP